MPLCYHPANAPVVAPAQTHLYNVMGLLFFLGEGHVEKTGLFEGTTSPELFTVIENNFRKADIMNTGIKYSSGYIDGSTISTTFIKDGKIHKTIRDSNFRGSETMGYLYPLLFLNQYVPLKKMESLRKPPHQEFIYNAFISGHKIKKIAQAGSLFVVDLSTISQRNAIETRTTIRIGVYRRFNAGRRRSPGNIPPGDHYRWAAVHILFQIRSLRNTRSRL